jgi:hypothetical protein
MGSRPHFSHLDDQLRHCHRHGLLTIDQPRACSVRPRNAAAKFARPKRGPIVLFEECSNWHVHSMDRDKGTWNESSEAGVWVNKASGRIVHWRKKKRQRLSEERQGPAKRSLKSSADVAPVDDNGFARRAREIIARAAHSKDAVHRRRGNRR